MALVRYLGNAIDVRLLMDLHATTAASRCHESPTSAKCRYFKSINVLLAPARYSQPGPIGRREETPHFHGGGLPGCYNVIMFRFFFLASLINSTLVYCR